MHELRSNATELSYMEQGPSQGPVALCLHGFPDIPRTWQRLSEALSDAGFRVIRPWMPGYFPSSTTVPVDPGAIAERVLALADELSPERPVYLVGHDWGALVAYLALAQEPNRFVAAATLAIPHPVAFALNMSRSLRQLGRSSYWPTLGLPGLSEWIVRRNDFRYIEDLWRRWSPGFEPEEGYLDEVKQCLRQSLPAPLFYYRALSLPSTWRKLLSARPIKVPTTYLHGVNDGCAGPEIIEGQERYFDAPFEKRLLPDAGHFLHLEQPDVVADTILRWFST